MKLYEYELDGFKLHIREYNVKDAGETFNVLRDGSNESIFIEYNALSRVPKDIVDSCIYSMNGSLFYYSVEESMNKAVNLFIEHIRDVVLPECKQQVKKSNEELDKNIATMVRLINNEIGKVS